jgi:hypothetical protein
MRVNRFLYLKDFGTVCLVRIEENTYCDHAWGQLRIPGIAEAFAR